MAPKGLTPPDEVRLADLLRRNEGPDAPQTGLSAEYVRMGRTYWGEPDRPTHVIITDTGALHGGRNPTLCGRSTDAGTEFGPDSAVTCEVCAKRLAALRAKDKHGDRSVSFRGYRRDGLVTTGHVAVADLARWVEDRYNRGWRSVTVFDGGDVVARIERKEGSGKRVWWAEDDAHPRETYPSELRPLRGEAGR